MIHAHNSSTPHTLQRHAVYYPPTGTGRDSYIMTDNGGTNIAYRLQGVPQTGNHMKFGPKNGDGYLHATPRRKSSSYVQPTGGARLRVQKYFADGSGRDNYVISHSGGLYNAEDECGVQIKKFQSTLRDGGWSKPPNFRHAAQSFTCRADNKAATNGQILMHTMTTYAWAEGTSIRNTKLLSEMSKTQRSLSHRLSAPKKKLEKYEEQMEEFKARMGLTNNEVK